MLVRMTHRGACGCEENTGDGAGILVAVPDGFLRKAAQEAGIGELPAEGEYAVGNIFVPKFENAIPEAKAIVERVCKQRGMKVRLLLLLLLQDARGALLQAVRRAPNVVAPSGRFEGVWSMPSLFQPYPSFTTRCSRYTAYGRVSCRVCSLFEKICIVTDSRTSS